MPRPGNRPPRAAAAGLPGGDRPAAKLGHWPDSAPVGPPAPPYFLPPFAPFFLSCFGFLTSFFCVLLPLAMTGLLVAASAGRGRPTRACTSCRPAAAKIGS